MEKIPHPSENPNWDTLTSTQRVEKEKTWRRIIKKNREKARRKLKSTTEVLDWSIKPQTMEHVLAHWPPILVGQHFPTRQKLEIKIAELCNILGKKPRYLRGKNDKPGEGGRKDKFGLCARSHQDQDNFMIKAGIKNNIWEVKEIRGINKSHFSNIEESHNRICAFTGKQLAPIILGMIQTETTIEYKVIKEMLEPFVKHECLTKGIISEAKKVAFELVYGSAKNNIRYIFQLEEYMEANGFNVDVDTCDKYFMENIILKNAEYKHKIMQKKLDVSRKTRFDENVWKRQNEDFLCNILGSDKSDFLLSFIFCPKHSIRFSNHCLKIVCADAAHVVWGTCTLYSVYAVSSGMNAVCLCHGIQAGNENEECWGKIINFLVKHYPNINNSKFTFITDRDKGLVKATAQENFLMTPFFCARHRTENIKKKYGAKISGHFFRLVDAKSLKQFKARKTELENILTESQWNYFFSVPDCVQFPICRIEDGGTLYEHSTQGIVEAMNNANKACRVKNMDFFNAIIKLAELERNRFFKFQNMAHLRAHPLTEYSRLKYQAGLEEFTCFKILNANSRWREIGICQATIVDRKTQKQFEVSILENGKNSSSWLKNSVLDTEKFIFKCSCEFHKFAHFPCVHLILLSDFCGIKSEQLVPKCYHTEQLKLQFPLDMEFPAINATSVKSLTPNDDLKAAVMEKNKSGRPQSKRRISAGEKKSSRVYLCGECRQPGHRSANCPLKI